MQLKKASLLIAFMLQVYFSYGQTTPNEKVNTSGAEAYFKIATLLEGGSADKAIPWQLLFQTPPYQMMISGKAIDTTVLKLEMRRMFSSTNPDVATSLSATEKYHQAYKDNQKQLEKYISVLHKVNVVDSIKALLYPFLPARLKTEALVPTLFYLNYGSADATGLGGIVINDLLHSYKIDTYKFGLLAAHEAFHSVVSNAFQQKLKQNIDYNATYFNLLYFLQNVSEEGMADLIDKPILLQKSSPLYTEVKELTANDETLSVSLIRKLASVLTQAYRSDQALLPYGSFTALANTFGKNGGHMPGRFMGSTIKKAGLLKAHIESVEDPVSFILTYNAAVKKSNKKYAVFSKESIAFLQSVKNKYWQD
jgi:hypothetical protein